MPNSNHTRILAGLLLTAALPADAALQQVAEIADLSLEQLTRITVTTASRREERLIEAPASIFVITAEDIRRSGATSLPEALRLAPNLQVMRGDSSQYVISARGGLTTTANKMLVLVDGRTVYTPLFSGVFYDALALLLEDVERIEVISGPGSTLWGTNAVNGVINVITRSAARTVGTLVAAGGGNQELGGSARMGWRSGSGAVRFYGRYFDRDAHQLASGASARDQADRWLTGLRGDWQRGNDTMTLDAEAYQANVDNLGGMRDVSGAHVRGRWENRLGDDSTLALQAYYDRTRREHLGSFKETRDTADIELNHMLPRSGSHHLAWGAGYRASRDETVPTAVLGFVPAGRTLSLASLYLQDEVQITSAVQATVGVRAERNSYTGLEWLPNARLSWLASPEHFVWVALTRTVRSPSRIDRDLVVPGFPPFVVVGNDTFASEIANVAELGYRARLGANASVSLTAFHHRYDELRTLEPVAGTTPPFVLANGASGRVSGLEAWGDLQPRSDWRLIWGVAFMRDRLEIDPGRVNLDVSPLGNNPRRTASLRSLWNVTPTVELDFMLRYVGDLPAPVVHSYTVLDARAGWRVTRDLELSLAVSNVLDRAYSEFGTPAQRAVFDRSWFAKATWSF